MIKRKRWYVAIIAALLAVCLGLGVTLFALSSQQSNEENTAEAIDIINENAFYTTMDSNPIKLTASNIGNYNYSGPLAAGSYILTDDLTLVKTIVISSTVTIDLNGWALFTDNSIAGPVFRITSGGTLNIKDSWYNPYSATYPTRMSKNNGEYRTLVCYDSSTGRILLQNTSSNYYYVAGGMIGNGKGYTWSSSISSTRGGNIYIDGGGTVNMYGGSLVGGYVSGTNGDGGAVYVNNGTFNMYGGNIAGNYAQRNGGGIAVGSNGVVNVNVTDKVVYIQRNVAGQYGGGVCLSDTTKTQTLTGGVTTLNNGSTYYRLQILKNYTSHTATYGWGGGVYLGATTPLTNDTIVADFECNVASAGGAILSAGLARTLKGTFYNNYANGNGGAIYSMGALTLTDAIVQGNEAGGYGGGVCAENNFAMSGTSSVLRNVCKTKGGGVWLKNNSGTSLTLSGKPTVKENFIVSTIGTISNHARSNGSAALNMNTDEISVTTNQCNLYNNSIAGGYRQITIPSKLSDGTDVRLYYDSYASASGTVGGNALTGGFKTYHSGGEPSYYFSLDNTNYDVILESSGEVVVDASPVATVKSNNGYFHVAYKYLKYSIERFNSESTFQYSCTDLMPYDSQKTLKLVRDIDVDSTLNPTIKSSGNVDFNGCTLKRTSGSSYVFAIQGNGSTSSKITVNVTSSTGGATKKFNADSTNHVYVSNASGSKSYSYGVITGGNTTTGQYAGGVQISNNAIVNWEKVNVIGNVGSTGGGFRVGDSGSELYLGDNTNIAGNKSDWGAIFITDNAKVEINGANIEDNYSARDGGGIHMGSAGGNLTLNSGTISNNQASGTTGTVSNGGGAIYMNAGTFTMNGGTISNNSTVGMGGALYIRSGATVNLYGGTISNNTSTGTVLSGKVGYGGAILNAGNLTIAGNNGGSCTISGNIATGYGGAIAATASFSITAGTITDNSATASAGMGGAIYLNGAGDYTFSGATFSSNRAPYGGAIYATSVCTSLTLNNCLFESNGTGNNSASNSITTIDGGAVYTLVRTTVTGGTMTNNVSSTRGGAVYYKYNATSANPSSFGGTYGGGTGKGNSSAAGSAVYIHEGCVNIPTGTVISYNATSAPVYVASGTVTMAGTISNNSSTQNGAGLQVAGGAVTVTGAINSNSSTANGGGVYMSGGTVSLTTGSINSNTAASNGGGVYMDGTTAVFNMTGGTMNGNWAKGTTTNTGLGGALYIATTGTTSKFTVSGGTISGNFAYNGGGAMYLASGSVVELSAGNITGNSSANASTIAGIYDAGNLKISGSPVVYNNKNNGSQTTSKFNIGSGSQANVYLPDGTTIQVVGTLADATNIGVTMADSSDFVTLDYSTYNGSATSYQTPATYFSADDTSLGNVILASDTVHSTTEVKFGGIVAQITNSANQSRSYSTMAEAVTEFNTYADFVNDNNKVLKLLANIKGSDAMTVTAQFSSTGILDLNGYILELDTGDTNSNYSAIWVRNNCQLTIRDSRDSNNTDSTYYVHNYTKDSSVNNVYKFSTPTGSSSSNSNVIYVGVGNSSIEGGVITGGHGQNGGGIYVDSGCTVILNAGTIAGNRSTSKSGGGLNVAGTFIMNGGAIAGNYAAGNGGGVYTSGTFTMNGGTISDNCAANGGGIYSAGTTTIASNTSISGNTGTSNGGGVYVLSGTFTMNGGTISNNATTADPTSAGNAGGGGFVSVGGTITIDHATISGNTATIYGGGLFAFNTITITNSEISGNSAAIGGGVATSNSFTGTVTLTGDTITLNTATSGNGGGVYVSNGVVDLSGSTSVTGNITTSGNGGGVYVGGGTTKVGGTLTVTDNHVASLMGDLNNLFLDEILGAATIQVGSALASGADIGISLGNYYDLRKITSTGYNTYNGTTDPSNYFSLDSWSINVTSGALYALALDDGTLENGINSKEVVLSTNPVVQLYSSVNNVRIGYATFSAAVTKFNSMTNDNTKELKLLVSAVPVTVTTPITQSGKLDLNGKILYYAGTANADNGSVLAVSGSDAKLTICDSSDSNTVNNYYTVDSNMKYNFFTADGDLLGSGTSLNTGVITGGTGTKFTNTNDNGGGGIYINEGAEVTFERGAIAGNSVTRASYNRGGGVYVSGGKFIMTGGSVEGNYSVGRGGGIAANGTGSTVTLSGSAKVDANKATGKDNQAGGGIWVNLSTLEISGNVSISNNTTPSYGGGIFAQTATITITGTQVTIAHNSASGQGGGIFADSGSPLTIKGGVTISGNSGSYGGGIYAKALDVTLGTAGGTDNIVVSGNSGSYGGGIYFGGSTSNILTMNSGSISGNKSNAGGGVFLYGTTFVMESGVIEKNTVTSTTQYGGGVYVKNGNFTMKGTSTIQMNKGIGGGVYLDGALTFTMEGGKIINNVSPTPGSVAGVYMTGSGTATGFGGEITLSGSAQITNNIRNGAITTDSQGFITGDSVTGGNGEYNLFIENGTGYATKITIGTAGLTDGSSIGISMRYVKTPYVITTGYNGNTTNGSDPDPETYQWDKKYFYLDEGSGLTENYLLQLIDSEVVLSSAVASLTDATVTKNFATWESALTSYNANSDNSKVIKLLTDLELQSVYTFTKTGTFDLNGKLFKYAQGSASTAFVTIGDASNQVTVTLIDSNPNTLHTSTAYGEGGASRNGGLITGGKKGGVAVADGSTFAIVGGEIDGNQSDTSGAGIYLNSGAKLTMAGGGVLGNLSGAGTGAGVYVSDGATFILGAIPDNVSLTAVKKVEINSNFVGEDMTNLTKSNVAFAKNTTKITVSGAINGESSIGITLASADDYTNKTVFTSDYNTYNSSQSPAVVFSSDVFGYTPSLTSADTSGEVYLSSHEHSWEMVAESDRIKLYCTNTSTCSLTDTVEVNGANMLYAGSVSMFVPGESSDGTKVNEVYDGTEKTPTIDNQLLVAEAYTADAIAFTYQYKQEAGGAYQATTQKKDAGYYEVTMTYTLGTINESITKEYVIEKAVVYVSANDLTITYGDNPTASNPGVTYDGFLQNDTADTLGISDTAVRVTYDGYAQYGNIGAYQNVIVPNVSDIQALTATNYTFTYHADDYKGALYVQPKELVINTEKIKVNGKTYDGTETATVEADSIVFTANSGLVNKDDVTVDYTAYFTDINAGQNKEVKITFDGLNGDKAMNYRLVTQSATVSGVTIAQRVVTVTGLTAENKTYDRDATATIVTTNAQIANVVAGESLSVTATGTFENVNAGVQTVKITGIELVTSSASGNYTIDLANSQKTTTATILKREITVSGVKVVDREYDKDDYNANLDYKEISFGNVVSGDEDYLGITAVGTYGNNNAFNNIVVTVDQIVLKGGANGDRSGNYTLTTTTLQVTGNIIQRSVTVSGIKAKDKVYDRTADVELIYDEVVITNLFEGDDLHVSADGEFADVNAQSNATVNLSNLTLWGNAINNYKLNSAGSQTTTEATISPRTLTITSGVEAADREYDGTDDATIKVDASKAIGFIEDDTVTIEAKGKFAQKNVGSNIAVSILSYETDSTNYVLDSENSVKVVTANITLRQIELITLGIQDKIYNGNTDGEVDSFRITFNQLVFGDNLTLTGVATFEDEFVGDGKAVTVTDIMLDGNDKSNYNLLVTTFETTGNIKPMPIDLPELGDKENITYSPERQTADDVLLSNDIYTVTGPADMTVGPKELTLTLVDPVNTCWPDGTNGTKTVSFNIIPLVVTIPHEDTNEYEYTGEEITYQIAESEYYTIIGATQTEAGEYIVTLKLNDTTNTVWQNNSRNDLTYIFKIGGTIAEQPMLWLEIVLGVALLFLCIWLIVLAKKKKKDKRTNAIIPLGILLATVPTWEYYLIIALAVIVLIMLILALALTHSYFKARKKKRELEANAEPVVTEGLQYELSADGTHYAVAGMGNCTKNKIVFAEKVDDVPVTEIKEGAFAGCKTLISVAIPASVTTIGEGAFKGCKSLESVRFLGEIVGMWYAYRKNKKRSLKKAIKNSAQTANALKKDYCNCKWLKEEG